MNKIEKESEYTSGQQAIIQKLVVDVVNKLFGLNISSLLVEKPKDLTHGDWATNIALKLSSELKSNPLEIAEKIVNELSNNKNSVIESVNVAKPGFINFTLGASYFKDKIKEVLIKKESYGNNDSLKGQKILIEHTSPNPTKAFHMGHFKNNITGLTVSYILEANGATVIRDCIDNNRGIAVSRLMYGYLKYAKKDESNPTDINYWYDNKDKWYTPEEKNEDPGMFIDKMYTQISEDFKNDKQVESTIRQMVIDWEAEDKINWELWALVQKWVWQGFETVLKRVNGWKFDKIWHEHEIYKKGKEHVINGLKKGIFQELEDGAILSNLQKDFGLSDTILIKNDGTSLYITQDLELTYLKKQTFNPDKMMWIIGPEQSLAMKQMFAICSQLGFGKYEDFFHIPYGFILVKDKDGNPSKMSSREGTQIYISELIDNAKEDIKKYITTENLTDTEIDNISEKVAIGAIKYSLLKVSRTQDIVFDYNTTISFEGDSGPYILYSYARANSIINKAQGMSENVELVLEQKDEINLAKQIDKLEYIISQSKNDFNFSIIADYSYELANLFNKFYANVNVLNEPNNNLKNSRLILIKAFMQTLKNALGLLGIETVDKM